jgi:bacillithiol biosynthesis cysteine-adding enzyme BshC
LGPRDRLDLGPLVKRARAVDPSLRSAFVAYDEGQRQLDRLFESDALCITTGQQPGLLLGPLFTVYKALTAVALARACAEMLGRAVTPVFWVAGDDHDFAEANHLYSLSPANAVERLVLRERSVDAPSLPLYRERLGADVDAVLTQLIEHSHETEFRSDSLDWLSRHYHAESDLATAFAGALAELLGPHGLVVFRPTHSAAKQAMAPHLLSILESAASVDEALVGRAATLEAEGRDAPVPVGDRATPVLIEAALGRDRLVGVNGQFVARRSREAWTLTQLESMAREDPERLSPNVLLRPAIEAAMFPTLAYVAGPGELAYLPQCLPLYQHLGVDPQRPVARWSGQIIETKVAKVLDKYSLAVEDLAAPEGKLEAQLVQGDMPHDATAALSVLRDVVAREYPRLQSAASGVDPTLKKSVQSALNTTLSALTDVEKRLTTHLKKQNDIVVQQIAKARHNLFPFGRPQERVFSLVPYLIRHGPGLLDAILAEAATALPSFDPPTLRA